LPAGLSVHPVWVNIQAAGSGWPDSHTLPDRTPLSIFSRNVYQVPTCQAKGYPFPMVTPSSKNQTWFVPQNIRV
jgi:hypothetical protein